MLVLLEVNEKFLIHLSRSYNITGFASCISTSFYPCELRRKLAHSRMNKRDRPQSGICAIQIEEAPKPTEEEIKEKELNHRYSGLFTRSGIVA